MTRKFFVWLHRWVGLLMMVFLIVVGLTGSILAFKTDIERMLTPVLFIFRYHKRVVSCGDYPVDMRLFPCDKMPHTNGINSDIAFPRFTQ